MSLEQSLDHVVLNFNKDSLLVLNICLAFIMFGVALKLKLENFTRLIKTPGPILVGLFAQFVLLPAFTCLLVLFLSPPAGVALGMVLVAACPGGNVSNFFSMRAQGNVELSVSITAISTVLCVFMTPFNLAFWSSFYPPAVAALQDVDLNLFHLILTITWVLLIPMFIGMLLSRKNPKLSDKIGPPIRKFSVVIFGLFIVVALAANIEHFLQHIHRVIFIVALHNGIALTTGYFMAGSVRLPLADRRSISIETGIQNSGLGLVLIFDFFEGLGGMAIVAAWWGVWHLVSGLLLSFYWSRKKLVCT